MYPHSGFRSGGTSTKTTLVEKHPFGNPGFLALEASEFGLDMWFLEEGLVSSSHGFGGILAEKPCWLHGGPDA